MTLGAFRSGRILFFIAWLLFIVKSCFYIFVTPIWEGFDELFHFGYVHSLAATKSLPVWGQTFIDAEIAQSTAYVPLPGLMPQLAPGFPKLSYRDYWDLSRADREGLRRELQQLGASANRFISSSVPLYQVQHPPLYYALCIPLYKAMEGRNIAEKVYGLRLFSALLASLCVLAAALIAKESGTASSAILGGLVALWPCLYVDTARVGNDSLGVAIYSFMFLYMARYSAKPGIRNAIGLGVLLGLGLLTKAYFLPAIPAIILFAGFLSFKRRDEWKRILLGASLCLMIAGIIGGWWYMRNYRLYGTFTGLQETMYYPSVGLTERIHAALSIPWPVIVKHIFVTFSWVSGWSFLHLPKYAYTVFVILFGAAAFGLIRSLISRNGEAVMAAARYETVAAICLLGSFTLGVAYHAINTYATVRFIGGPGGWYFYALVVPLSWIVSFGVWKASPSLFRPCFTTLYVGIIAAEVYGFGGILAPYYAGIAIPSGDGWGVIFPGGGSHIYFAEAINRLTDGGAISISIAFLISMAAAYLILHLAVLWIVLAQTAPSAEKERGPSSGLASC